MTYTSKAPRIFSTLSARGVYPGYGIGYRDQNLLYLGICENNEQHAINSKGILVKIPNTADAAAQVKVWRNNGITFNIEGVDSVGKATHTRLLKEWLDSLPGRLNTTSYTFPDYQSKTGMLVKSYLNGEFGNAIDVPCEMASALYMLDRAKYRPGMVKNLKHGGINILDRYVYSNVAFQSVKHGGFDKATLHHVKTLCEGIEFGEIGLPVPDKVVFLAGHPVVVKRLMDARTNNDSTADGSGKDQHESNMDLLTNAYSAYDHLSKDSNWAKVHVTVGDQIKSIDDIQREVRNVFLKAATESKD